MIKGTVKDFFIYLGIATVLYVLLGILTFLSFDYIDLLIHGNTRYSQSYSPDSIRWKISAVVVLFPLLAGLSYLVNMDIRQDPSKLEIRSRKWLLYSVVFVSSASSVVVLFPLVYGFLGGDMPKEFVLKSLSVLTIGGIALVYYFLELKRKGDHPSQEERLKAAALPSSIKLLSGGVVVIITAVLAFGFYKIGTPGYQRQQKRDQQRLMDLSTIERSIDEYYRIEHSLPTTIEELTKDYGGYAKLYELPKDPETQKLYEYKITDANTYELCADFEGNKGSESSLLIQKWDYYPGRNCFSGQVFIDQKKSAAK